ncbi:MAG TPA: Lrp/AsnC family transcriptional regulator [Acetobacteraceae bacterium]
MDEVDRKLLALLQQDSTVAMSDLAEQVGLSATPVWKRIQKMEQAEVILRRVALVAPEQVGIGLIVFVAIEAHEHTPDWLAGFAAAMDSMPEVMDAYRMAGEVDYMLRVAVADMAAFDGFYMRLIAAVPLKNVTSRFAMERLKGTTAYPLSAGAFRDRRTADTDA